MNTEELIISKDFVQSLVEYLSTKPWREVAHLIPALLSLHPLPSIVKD